MVCFPCLPCLPQGGSRKRQQEQAINGSHRAGYYNTQLRSNLGMAERPLRLPVMIADDEQPQQPQSTYQGSDASLVQPQQQQFRLDVPGPTPNSSYASFSSAPKPRGRFPTTSSVGSGKTFSDVPMETAQLTELFDKLAKIDFIPYAICGRGALVDHGLSARKTKQVSIVVPSHSANVIAGWARTSGWISSSASAVAAQGKASIFVGIPLADGSVRQLRIKYLDEEQFEQLERVRSRLSSKAWVLSLTSQLDHLAAAWVDYHKKAEEKRAKAEARGRDSSSTTTGGTVMTGKAEREIARDFLWCLDRMARTRVQGTSGADTRLLQTLASEDFFVPFTQRHPEALAEMARAGVDVAAIMTGLRDRDSVREHNEMLAEYGAAPLDRFSSALPFAGIRDLNNSKSVYTLATNNSATELGLTNVATAPEPARPSTGAAALLDRITGQARRGSGGSGRTRRSRSVRISGGRPSISGPIAMQGLPDRGLTRSLSNAGVPPPPRRTSEISRADSVRRSSDQWI